MYPHQSHLGIGINALKAMNAFREMEKQSLTDNVFTDLYLHPERRLAKRANTLQNICLMLCDEAIGAEESYSHFCALALILYTRWMNNGILAGKPAKEILCSAMYGEKEAMLITGPRIVRLTEDEVLQSREDIYNSIRPGTIERWEEAYKLYRFLH